MRRISYVSKLLSGATPCDQALARRVLIVEDDWLIALALQDMVERAGYVVVGPASDLAAAIDLAKDGAIDAAILDYRLHAATVQPVIEILLARNIAFAFATGFFIDRDVSAGAPIMTKPYMFEDVRTVLHRMLGDPVPHRGDAEPTLGKFVEL